MTSELRRWCEDRRRGGSARFSAETSATLRRTLHLAREHLGMDVAWLAHVPPNPDGPRRITIQLVDGDVGTFELDEGPASPDLTGFIDRLRSGDLPPVAADVHQIDPDLALALGIGSYVAVVVTGGQGQPYGVLAGLSGQPNETLRMRDAATLRLFGDMQSETITAYEARHGLAEKFLANAEAMLDAGGPQIALQPILDMNTQRPVAQEALSRFPSDAYTTQEWFIEAWKVGCGLELELDAMTGALALLPALPPEQRLSINTSPDLMISPRLVEALDDQPWHRLIFEITEHNLAESIGALIERVAHLQKMGAWVAIDDAGTGYSSLSQILQLGPDIIKLDRALVSDVDTDPMKRALASAIVTFTSQAKVGLVAEGVETEGELKTLRELGVPFAQGYFLARPGPSSEIA